MQIRLAFAVLAATAMACGGGPLSSGFGTGQGTDGGSGAPGTSPPPRVTILAPEPNHQFEFEDEDDDHHGDDRFQIEVEVEGVELAEPGRCSGRGPCGHLVLLIDGNACGNPNATSSSRSFQGHFGRCLKPSGQHQIVVLLVDERGQVLATSQAVLVRVKFHRHGDDDDDDDDD